MLAGWRRATRGRRCGTGGTSVLGGLLPLALAVALSPVPIIAIVVVLGTPRGRSNGPSFALGWVLGLVAVSVIVLLATGGADGSDSATSTAVDVAKVAIGLLFGVLAVKQLRKRPRKGEEPSMPKWMASMGDVTARRAFTLGLVLSGANPKNLALTAAAAATIAQAGMTSADNTVAVAVFVALGSTTVVGLVLFSLVAGARAASVLDAVHDFMASYNAVIMFVLLVVIGAKLIGDGVAGLAA